MDGWMDGWMSNCNITQVPASKGKYVLFNKIGTNKDVYLLLGSYMNIHDTNTSAAFSSSLILPSLPSDSTFNF